MNNYQFEPYENNKNLNAFKITNNGNDLVAAIIDAVETGLENTGITDIKTNYVEISDTTPVTIPPGMYDGTAKAKLSDSELAKIIPENIKKGITILGKTGIYEDQLEAYFNDTLTTINNSTATSLNPSQFEGKTSLQSVKFTNITSVNNRAFYGCGGLQSVDMPNVTSIKIDSFNGCSGLKTINMPNLIEAQSQSLDHHGMTKISFPNLQTAGRYAFRSNSLIEIDLGKIISISGASSIESCPNLQKIIMNYLEETSTYYSSGPFNSYAYLQELNFPKLKNICGLCFKNCSVLNKIILHSSALCSLADISAFQGTPFASGNAGGTLYVPQALIEDYQAATNWSVILSYPNNQILPIEGSEYEITEEAGN